MSFWVFSQLFSESRGTPLFVGLPRRHLALFGTISHQACRVDELGVHLASKGPTGIVHMSLPCLVRRTRCSSCICLWDLPSILMAQSQIAHDNITQSSLFPQLRFYSPSRTMAARPPPARPHIGIHPSFNAKSNTDWAEDDVWDSASDSESPRHSTIAHAWRYSSNTQSKRQPSLPKPVPKPPTNSSSSTLAQSYTHLNPPSPSSYPPKSESGQPPSAKGGWTMVMKSSVSQSSMDGTTSNLHRDADVDGDMVVGDLDPEVVESGTADKIRQERGSVKPDVENIMNGIDRYF